MLPSNGGVVGLAAVEVHRTADSERKLRRVGTPLRDGNWDIVSNRQLQRQGEC